MKRVLWFVLAGLVVLVGLGCPGKGPDPSVPPRADRDEPVTQEDLAEAVRGNNRFSLELFTQLGSGKGNVFLSPFSVSSALAMTAVGAEGKTKDEMAATLHLLGPGKRDRALGQILKQVRSEGTGVSLSVANALWAQQGRPFKKSFLQTTEEDYAAGLHPVDFEGNAAGARKAINDWVARETKEKIKDLLPPGSPTKDTRLMLTNAIYFKGNWASRFPRRGSRDGVGFHLASGKQVQVTMMEQSQEFPYLQGEDFQALELPYQGDTFALLVLLPATPTGLPALEKKLTPEALDGWVGHLKKTRVETYLPRFEAGTKAELSKDLTALGLREAFTEAADFSGIDGSRDLFIKQVLHEAVIEVNEEGTEAAGATLVEIEKSEPGAVSRRPPEFRADRPFLYLVLDKRNGSILFLGRMTNPRE